MLALALLGILLLAGILVGMGAMVCLGIVREERRKSLHKDPPGAAAAATRGLVGYHSLGPSAAVPDDRDWMDRTNGVFS